VQCVEVACDLHNRHLSSQLDSLFPPLQEQVTLFPLAVHVAVCSESLQNSLQSSSSSFSQVDVGEENKKAFVMIRDGFADPKSEIELV
jgi:hypothetical protein